MNDPKAKVSRRKVFAGAGAAGALAVVASVAPRAPEPAAKADKLAGASKASGYQESQHVLQYYQTARI